MNNLEFFRLPGGIIWASPSCYAAPASRRNINSYEIPFNWHFYEYEASCLLAEIKSTIVALEGRAVAILKGIIA